jgi:two-component system chemotaxis response regulator CheB
MEHLNAIGNPSTFTCPDCGGSLWQITGAAAQRFVCHTGHAFTLESLRRTQSLATDEALWSAIRALQEKRVLVLAAAKVASIQGDLAKAAELGDAAGQLDNSAQNLRTLVEQVDETS